MSRALEILKMHERYRKKTLNMIPSENVQSPRVLRALASDLTGRYSLRPQYYSGTRYIDELWSYAEEQAKKLFRAEYVLLEPLSGHIAALLTYITFAKHRKMACLHPDFGGYPGNAPEKLPDIIDAEVIYLPASMERLLPDAEKSIEIIRSQKPDFVVLGGSRMLFPHPVKEFAEVVHEYGGILAYDGAHVLGLIAGGVFQDPLREGADILFASTHKTFPGPQGGLVLTNDEELYRKLLRNIFHKIADNIHFNKIAALAVSFEEMLKYGRQYAQRIVENAKSLAKGLDELEVPVKAKEWGYTESHQVILDFQNQEEREELRRRLEECGIITDADLRLGTGEVTRRGMGKREMARIAQLIKRAIEGENPKAVKRDVQRLLSRFNEIRYC
ncbi:MAG: beta-eliminating lyase-related protein [Nitrososphaeria archaeon]|nr:beta-eliminating lyase-related protein [Nitrososphaeria archaeon]